MVYYNRRFGPYIKREITRESCAQHVDDDFRIKVQTIGQDYNMVMNMISYKTLLSQLYHFVVYSFKRPKTRLENGMFIISVDVDVGNMELGIINKGKNDANVNVRFSEYSIGEIEERALPLFVNLFNHFEIPVTFALRGQLTEVGDSILPLLLKSPIKHDIGAHGYYHREFRNLSQSEAENELRMISVGMKKFGIIPRSFVFPRNNVAHLKLLEKYGYKCYRGYHTCMCIEKKGGLYNIHPSLFLDQSISSLFLKKIINICIAKKLPFHVWFHLWNFGKRKESIHRNINKLFFPLFEYAQQKVKVGTLMFETMSSAAEKVEML